MCEIEDKLGFDLSTEEAEKIASVQDALNVFVTNYTKKKKTTPPQETKG